MMTINIPAANFLAMIGRATLGLMAEIGRIALFARDALLQGLTPGYYGRQILLQFFRIGYTSLPVVALTAFFTGGALALQIYLGSSRFNAESLVASIVALGITRELGPVLAGLMVSGRVGASIAAELGTMRVTEQIDALTTLSTNPLKYLVGPRLIASVVSLPLLVFIADVIGVMGGYIVGTRSLGFNPYAYLKNTADFLEWGDVSSGLIKAAVFGFIIALMGCYHGFNSKGGAQGVGRATTNAVVSSAIMILAANFILTSLLFKN
jgi:phospholipid/cholesterol/gamma-HCH transport system permease protein